MNTNPPVNPINVPAAAVNCPTYTGLLDWGRKEHTRIWEEGVKPTMDKYSMEPLSKSSFVLQTKLKAQDFELSTKYGTGILDIQNGGEFLSLLDHYGSLLINEVQAYVKSWIDRTSRASQDDEIVYEYVCKTLSNDALLQAFQKSDQFYVDMTGGPQPSRVLFLKTVLDKSSLSSQAMVMKHKKELTQLPRLMENHKWNIPKFNEAVQAIELALTQYGSTAPDLLHQLMPAYLRCPEPKFRAYIKQKKNAYEDGSLVLSAKSLMDFAQSKYLTQRDQDDWNPGIDDNRKDSIFALKAKVKALTKLVMGTKTNDPDKPGRKKHKSKASKGKDSGGKPLQGRDDPHA